MYKRRISLLLTVLLIAGLFAGCGTPAAAPGPADAAPPPQEEPTPNPEPVTLTVAGPWPDCRAIEGVGRAFTAKYPNCTVVYEYLQNYYDALEKRMAGADVVDVFFSTNIQADSALLPYATDFLSCEGLDLSQTFDGLIENFTLRDAGDGPDRLYAIPLGAELRGLYVNTTLLSSLGLKVPTDQASLLAACEALKTNGYIPFHGNPGNFSQLLIYPWICNIVANAADPKATYGRINAQEAGVSELFREPLAFLYGLVENGYYDYKLAQTELNLFTGTSEEDYARYFLSIRQNGDVWEKADDVGQVAFMPSAMSVQSLIEKTKEDYHSQIEYVFIPAPVSPAGGFAYLSPARGIGANQTSDRLEWSVRFLDFLFQPENNKLFAAEFDIIPNTKEAFDYIDSLYDIPDDRISHLGQVTFDFDFYDAVTDSLLEISKGNNPKYMQTNADGSVTLYSFDSYMQNFEERLTAK